jgi:hypothetical protein
LIDNAHDMSARVPGRSPTKPSSFGGTLIMDEPSSWMASRHFFLAFSLTLECLAAHGLNGGAVQRPPAPLPLVRRTRTFVPPHANHNNASESVMRLGHF